MAVYTPYSSVDSTAALVAERFASWVYHTRCTTDACTIHKINGDDEHDECECNPETSADTAALGSRIIHGWLSALGDEPSLIGALVVHGYMASSKYTNMNRHSFRRGRRFGPSPLTAFRKALSIGISAAEAHCRQHKGQRTPFTRPWDKALPALKWMAPPRDWIPDVPYYIPQPYSSPSQWTLLSPTYRSMSDGFRHFDTPQGMYRRDCTHGGRDVQLWECSHGRVKYDMERYYVYPEERRFFTLGPLGYTPLRARLAPAADQTDDDIETTALVSGPDETDDAPIIVLWACSHGELYICGAPRNPITQAPAIRNRAAKPAGLTIRIKMPNAGTSSQNEGQLVPSASTSSMGTYRDQNTFNHLQDSGLESAVPPPSRSQQAWSECAERNRALDAVQEAKPPRREFEEGSASSASRAATRPHGLATSLSVFTSHRHAGPSAPSVPPPRAPSPLAMRKPAYDEETMVRTVRGTFPRSYFSATPEPATRCAPRQLYQKRKRDPADAPAPPPAPAARRRAVIPAPNEDDGTGTIVCGINGCNARVHARDESPADAPTTAHWTAHLASAHDIAAGGWRARACPLAGCAGRTYGAWSSFARHVHTKHFGGAGLGGRGGAGGFRCPYPSCASEPMSRPDAVIRHYERAHEGSCPDRVREALGMGGRAKGASARGGRKGRSKVVEVDDGDDVSEAVSQIDAMDIAEDA